MSRGISVDFCCFYIAIYSGKLEQPPGLQKKYHGINEIQNETHLPPSIPTLI